MFDNLTHKIQSFSDRFSKHVKKQFQSVLYQGEKISRKGKVQIEIEKLKWELKHKYNELGQHVAEKKLSKSVTDFSYDRQFLEIVNEVNKIKLYIEERQKERNSRDAKVIGKE